jgi:hypothetical protein
MVFVLCDSMDSSAYDSWLFTLNGLNDTQSLLMLGGANFYLGFIDTYGGDNHGTSTVEVVPPCPTPTDASSWGAVKTVFK